MLRNFQQLFRIVKQADLKPRYWNTGSFSLFALVLSFGLFYSKQSWSQEMNSALPWPQFLGIHGNSTVAERSNTPINWDRANFVWDTEIPGKGWSSPVFSERHIWITTAIPHHDESIEGTGSSGRIERLELRAVCVDIDDGQILHNLLLNEVDKPAPINPLNSYASPTPVIDGDYVVCHFGSFGTWCLDSKTGKQLWQTQYVIDHGVGPGSSPVVYDGIVILVCDGIDQQFLVGLDVASGNELWKTNRPAMKGADGDVHKAYCTPLLTEINGTVQAIVPTAQWIAAYEPKSGREIWRAEHGSGFSLVCVPVLVDGLIIFSTGYMQPEFVAIDPTGSGDVTQTHIRWRAKNAPNMPSFVIYERRLYSISDRGVLTCLDAKTGETIFSRRIGGNYSSTPLLVGNKLYLSSREGLITVLDLDREAFELARMDMPVGVMASPAVFGQDLILRTEQRLYRISSNAN
ncbi:MAG TPA: PQQ-binding-like beta-propeller repeat protein [Pirellulaceae bacterium]|nr:PQQ-binding-like beta-propeller repeat protein [Pirellulaceae bacterium]HMO93710.1 PQQ-binding-like beta-propeller repeat protein [Pirellulaceae bacterium]HMP69787.1 PQQ-binding-like beta-propeller repeat protein [Pirellulaceae bacterium]